MRISDRRKEFVLASKGGMFRNAQGQREIDGRPEVIKKTCEDSLTRLRTDVIDLYYLHRWDKRLPIEESVGALAELVAQGKVRTIGLSEVSASTIRKAHRVHPISAVQTEYSLWTRNAEVAVLQACKELGISFRGVQSPRPRLPHGRAPRRVRAAPEGHPPGDAPLSGGALRQEPRAARWAVEHCASERLAPWRRSRWPGCWRKASTSSRFLEPHASIIWRRTWARPPCG